MNILWIYNLPLRPEVGGTERITSLVAKGLSLRGYKCMDILVFNENTGKLTYKSKEVDDLYDFLVLNKVDVVINQIAYAKWLLEAFLEKGGDKWRQEGGRIISCLHFDPKNPSYYFFLNSNRNKNLKDRVNLLKAALLYKYHQYKQEKKEGDIYNYIYDHSDKVVVLSSTHIPYMKKVMKRIEYSRMVAINNPLTFDTVSSPDIIKEKKKVALVCARMSEYHKRISIILQVWRQLQKNKVSHDWILKVVGDGPDLEGYKKFVDEMKIQNVQFEGQRYPEPYYEEASILLLTSSAEGWGLTITEGLQRGVVPVVMNSCPVFSEIICDGKNGFLTPNNRLKQYEKKILRLMSDDSLLESMQEQALESAYRFSMDSTMDKWVKILHD